MTRHLRVGSPALAALVRARLEEARRILTGGGAEMVLLTVPCAVPLPGEAAAVDQHQR